MSASEQHVRTELEGLHDLALVVDDPRMAEQLLLVVGVVTEVHALHQVDAKHECLQCRSAGKRLLWRRRQPCTVREVFERVGLDVQRIRRSE